MLQSSKERAKPATTVLISEFRFPQIAAAVALGKRRELR
jgi:hypothetical protein